MGIRIKEKDGKRIFTLHTDHTTYQMMADEHNVLLHLYYGRRAEGDMDYLLTYADRGLSGNPYDAGGDRRYSLDVLPQEFPCQGSGDFRSPAFRVSLEDGTEGCDLRFVSAEVSKGKYSIPGLPALSDRPQNDQEGCRAGRKDMAASARTLCDTGETEPETLTVLLEDARLHLQVYLLYGVLPEADLVTRCVQVRNEGTQKIYLEKVLSASLDYPGGAFDLITFYGRHGMERTLNRVPVGHFAQSIGSRRGMSSHQYNPFMILAENSCTEVAGSCCGLQLVWSGGFTGQAEKDQLNQTRVQLGLMEEGFRYPLEHGDLFTAPEAVLCFSDEGLGELSRRLHRGLRRHLIRNPLKDCMSPILLNSWEAFYFSFTGKDILRLAEETAKLGADMLVLDDGWFGKRDNDRSGLGDWKANEEKLGCSLGELSRGIHERGVKFGLWVEPEMVSEDSDLYRAHPDWALTIPGKPPVRGRFQLVLDFSRKQVVDEIFRMLCDILDHADIDYLKWDFNRCITDVYSPEAACQGMVLYDYMIGLYDLLERLRKRYPDLLIEGCSGGGGRFDAGMLAYTPQIWCSDNTDAVGRLSIQYGTSFGYPVSSMGAHISAVPNEQCGRITSLVTRSVVAMSGTYGLELDPGKMTEEEKAIVRREIGFRREWDLLIREGDLYRLSDPASDEVAAWAFVSPEKDRVLLNIVNLLTHCNRPVSYLKLSGLAADAVYSCKRVERPEEEKKLDRLFRPFPVSFTASGAALMETGFPVPVERGEYLAMQWILEKQ